MESAIYSGTLYHTRRAPPAHRFKYAMRLFFLDLDVLPSLVKETRFWGLNSGLCGFFCRDFIPQYSTHTTDGAIKLSALQIIRKHTGQSFFGKIFLLAAPRVAGIGFNPLSLYYCYENDALRYVIAEVRNTPWTERHVYFLDITQPASLTHDKAFHVSPFMDMAQQYQWTLPAPEEHLKVSLRNSRNGRVMFCAELQLNKVAQLTPAQLQKELWHYWPQSLKTLIGIYWQAVKMLLKGAPFYTHPRKIEPPTNPTKEDGV